MGDVFDRIAAMPAKHRKNVPSLSATNFRVVSMTHPFGASIWLGTTGSASVFFLMSDTLVSRRLAREQPLAEPVAPAVSPTTAIAAPRWPLRSPVQSSLP